jgi:hypothetical protein
MNETKATIPTGLGVLLAASLLLVPAAAIAAEGAAGDIPRTASGRPDLSGTYDVATLTPLSRPAQYGDKLTLTDEEAEQIAEYWRSNLEKDSQPSDPDREAPPEGGTEFYIPEFNGAAGGVGGYNAFFVDLGDSNFKIDGKYRTSILVDPPDGRFPPLTDEAKQRFAAGAAFRQPNTGTAWWIDQDTGPYDDPEVRPAAERCLLGFGSTQGPPMLPVMYNNHKRILQTEDTVMILVEMNHDARIVRMNAEHEPPEIRKWLGDSIGWWEGDTLVVDTTNFREEPGFSQASDALHVVERFTRVDADSLLYQFTVEDPKTWTKPFTGEYIWPATTNKVYEYACHEGNYALGNIMRGARVLEEEALAARDDNSGQ